MDATAARPRVIVEALVESLIAKCAEVLLIDPAAVRARTQAQAPSAARAACWQVLVEAGWTSTELGEVFDRDHSTVASQAHVSERKARVDPDHAYLVSELRRVVREDTRQGGFSTLEDRTHAQLWALDQEIAASSALRDQLVTRITTASRLRAELAAVLADFAAHDNVITRVREAVAS